MEEQGRVWFVPFWACLMYYDGFNLFLCDMDPHVDLSALHSSGDRKNCCGASRRHFNGVLVEMETDPSVPPPPVCSVFFPPLFFLSILTLSLKHSHSRKNPIIEISGPCWKRDSLWNVFGVTQRQCLSCPSANRMLCAGERREIRTDNGKRERPQKRQLRGERTTWTEMGGKKQLGDWCWSDDPKRDRSRAVVQLQYH